MQTATQNIIDFHTHAFPDALAPRAVAQLTINAAASGYTPLTDGTVAGLIASMDRAGIAKSVVCNIATNPRQMKKVNDFAISCMENPRLIPLGSVNPHGTPEEIDTELNRLKAAGIPGIKVHPDYMKVEIDSEKFTPILAACAEKNLFVITHAGFDPVEPDHIHCAPDMVLRVMDRHPALKLVVAHTGGFDREEEVLEKLCGAPVWLDTSLSAVRIPSKLETIPASAFANCTSLSHVDFSDASSLHTIKKSAFASCTALSTVEFPKELVSVEKNAFQNCNRLNVVVFSDNMTRVNKDAFGGRIPVALQIPEHLIPLYAEMFGLVIEEPSTAEDIPSAPNGEMDPATNPAA
jgi:predicted TIM-barrel fold metal-dependent hydrolase